SCANLGVLRLKAGQHGAGAGKLLEKACAAGVGKGCNALGVVAAKGTLGNVDFAAAMKHYLYAGDLGYISACFNVGWAYHDGQGVPKDKNKAEAIYERACAGGERAACMNLGVLIVDKTGPARDMTRVVKLFERACYGGDGLACANLAVVYAKGD